MKWIYHKDTFGFKEGLRYHTAVVYNDSMYVVGGVNGTPNEFDTFVLKNCFYRYNFLNREWTSVQANGDAPPPIFQHTAVLYR
jgi:hypothetical protein